MKTKTFAATLMLTLLMPAAWAGCGPVCPEWSLVAELAGQLAECGGGAPGPECSPPAVEEAAIAPGLHAVLDSTLSAAWPGDVGAIYLDPGRTLIWEASWDLVRQRQSWADAAADAVYQRARRALGRAVVRKVPRGDGGTDCVALPPTSSDLEVSILLRHLRPLLPNLCEFAQEGMGLVPAEGAEGIGLEPDQGFERLAQDVRDTAGRLGLSPGEILSRLALALRDEP